MFKRKKFVIGVTIVVVAIGYLGFIGLANAAVHYEIADLVAMGNEAYDQRLRVSGIVLAGSIDRDVASLTVQFTVIQGGETLPVVYTGIIPDTFKEDVDIIVEGELARNGVFQADLILTKCPSKYEPEE